MKPIKFSDRLPEIDQSVMALCDYSNHSVHVVRRITSQEFWFYVVTGEICKEDIEQEFTHWIPLDHPHDWN